MKERCRTMKSQETKEVGRKRETLRDRDRQRDGETEDGREIQNDLEAETRGTESHSRVLEPRAIPIMPKRSPSDNLRQAPTSPSDKLLATSTPAHRTEHGPHMCQDTIEATCSIPLGPCRAPGPGATGQMPGEAQKTKHLTKVAQPTANSQDLNPSQSGPRAQALNPTMRVPGPPHSL